MVGSIQLTHTQTVIMLIARNLGLQCQSESGWCCPELASRHRRKRLYRFRRCRSGSLSSCWLTLARHVPTAAPLQPPVQAAAYICKKRVVNCIITMLLLHTDIWPMLLMLCCWFMGDNIGQQAKDAPEEHEKAAPWLSSCTWAT